MKSLSRIQKLLALSASAALIGNPHEANAALTRAAAIAKEHGIDLAPLARAAGVELPRPRPVPTIQTGVYTAPFRPTLTRTVSADNLVEICTLGRDGRTEVYCDVDGDGIRSFLGYAEDLSVEEYRTFHPLMRIHWHTHDTHWRAAA